MTHSRVSLVIQVCHDSFMCAITHSYVPRLIHVCHDTLYIYIYMYTHMYIYTYMPTYMPTYIYLYMYIYIHIYTFIGIYLHIYVKCSFFCVLGIHSIHAGIHSIHTHGMWDLQNAKEKEKERGCMSMTEQPTGRPALIDTGRRRIMTSSQLLVLLQ
jgi:hypothetical protein